MAADASKADVQFAQQMIPHHQAAVSMAQRVLQQGGNPEIAKLAKAVIAAQTKEITFLQAWLKAHNASAPASGNSMKKM